MGCADVNCLADGTAQHLLLVHVSFGTLFPQSAPEW